MVDFAPPMTGKNIVSEELLLDVGVEAFDPNIPETFDEQVKQNINPEVRRAEVNYMSHYLKNLLQGTGNWGAVRVIPRKTNAVDVSISAKLLHSDGERMILEATVYDARGHVWFTKQYTTLASKFSYEPEIAQTIDPFHATHRQIADDMLNYRNSLPDDEVKTIRRTAEIRFAHDFSEDAFGDHAKLADNGQYQLVRLPAEDDPMLLHIRKIREREYLFIDTLDGFYDNFATAIYQPYLDWRRETHDEAIAIQKEKALSKARLVAGTTMIVGGAVMQRNSNSLVETAGYSGVIGGAIQIINSIQNRANAKLHAEVLAELGNAAETQILPYTIELENESLSLEGSVHEQYEKLRQVLKRLYFEEMGLPLSPVLSSSVKRGEVDDDEEQNLIP